MNQIKKFIGNDHAALVYKNILLEYCKKKNYQIDDKGTFTNQSYDYNDYAVNVCNEVIKSNGIGILICSSGVGISMMANKVKGIRCGQVSDYDSTLKEIEIGCNVISLVQELLVLKLLSKLLTLFFLIIAKLKTMKLKRKFQELKKKTIENDQQNQIITFKTIYRMNSFLCN